MSSEVSALRRCPIDVFRYLDYRSFLADFYQAKKRRGFSYRAFSRSAGLGAPNYLKLVISGKRNLTAKMAERFAASCGLSGDAAAYFQNLVEFNQASEACNAAWSTGAVMTALTNNEVQAALEQSPVLYGADRTPGDGQNFQLTIGMRQVQVGGPCTAADRDCKEIPAGVQALVTLLQQIDQFEDTQACAMFPR